MTQMDADVGCGNLAAVGRFGAPPSGLFNFVIQSEGDALGYGGLPLRGEGDDLCGMRVRVAALTGPAALMKRKMKMKRKTRFGWRGAGLDSGAPG